MELMINLTAMQSRRSPFESRADQLSMFPQKRISAEPDGIPMVERDLELAQLMEYSSMEATASLSGGLAGFLLKCTNVTCQEVIKES